MKRPRNLYNIIYLVLHFEKKSRGETSSPGKGPGHRLARREEGEVKWMHTDFDE